MMTNAEVTAAAFAVAEKLVKAVPEGTTNMVAITSMAIALGISLHQIDDREAALDVMCDIIRQTARGQRVN